MTAPPGWEGEEDKSDTNGRVFVGLSFIFVSFSYRDVWGREVCRDVWLTRHADVAAMLVDEK